MTILIETAIALTAASAGAAAGWYLHRQTESQSKEGGQADLPAAEEMAREAARSQKAAKELLTQVHGVTTKVAAQVGEHNERVQAISVQLTSGKMHDLVDITNAVTRLVEANAWMQQQLATAESRLASHARLIEAHVNEARTDALTGIANRRALDEELQRCLELRRSAGTPASVMMFDVDFFKTFNDTHGHKAGDEVLRQVARQLKNAAGEAGIVCRYGGEEFTIVFPNLKGPEAVPLAEKCRAAICSGTIAYEGQTLQVQASAGLAEFNSQDTPESVLERADEALYASKRAGRNCGHLHSGEAFLPFVNPPVTTATTDSPSTTSASAPPSQANAAPDDPSHSPLLDPITGLSTRDALRDDLQRRLAARDREMPTLSLLIVQVDRLNVWTERGGNQGQSLALRAVALALRGVSREMDHAARFENDSFAVALHGANLDTAVEVAQRLHASLQVARPKLAGEPTMITLSTGVCEALPGDDSARLFLRGQAAQNTSANMGGNHIATHDGKNIRLVEEATAELA